MLSDSHVDFVEKYATPGEHYSFDENPLGFHRKIPQEKFIELSIQHHSPDVRAYAARQKEATPEQLEKLLSDPHPTVREVAAMHPNISPEQKPRAIDISANSYWSSNRVWAAKNLPAGSNHFLNLATDDSWQVRRAIAGNPNIEKDHLHVLLHDHSIDVQDAAVGNPAYKKHFPEGY